MSGASVPREVTQRLYDALLRTHTYVAAIADGKQPAISAEGRRIAAERLELLDAALAEAGEYLSATRHGGS